MIIRGALLWVPGKFYSPYPTHHHGRLARRDNNMQGRVGSGDGCGGTTLGREVMSRVTLCRGKGQEGTPVEEEPAEA